MIHIPPSRETSAPAENPHDRPTWMAPGRREIVALALRDAPLARVAPAPLAVSRWNLLSEA